MSRGKERGGRLNASMSAHNSIQNSTDTEKAFITPLTREVGG